MDYKFAFGDESGETGFKFGQGSTIYFVATLILTNRPNELRSYLENFKRLRYLTKEQELHFRKTPDQKRVLFLKPLAKFDLPIYSLAVDKWALSNEIQRLAKVDFYTWTFAELIQRIDTLHETKVVLDEISDPSKNIRALKRLLRAKLKTEVYYERISQITMNKSHREPALQTADMISGAIYRYVHEGDHRFYRLIDSQTTLWRI